MRIIFTSKSSVGLGVAEQDMAEFPRDFPLPTPVCPFSLTAIRAEQTVCETRSILAKYQQRDVLWEKEMI